MSHYIVLVKQVPDVTQITDNAFDPKTGNLMRGKLASVINELDAQALAFAARMRHLEPDRQDQQSKIIALTMGPPMADEVLRYALSRGADEAVLLTDRVLGGADTWATANPLACAIRKIVKDQLGGTHDYYVVSGMQSVDGDTAQVPAQIAEEMKIPCVSYATEVEFKNKRFEFTRIISGGSQIVTPKSKPAVVTVAKYEFPLFPTFAATRKANATKIIQWTAEDVKPIYFGVTGSKTRVIRVFPPPKTSRKCHEIKEVREFAQTLKKLAKPGQTHASLESHTNHRYILPAQRTNPFDRSFEGMQKESEAFDQVVKKLKELNIRNLSDVTAAVKEQIVQDKSLGITAKALDEMLSGLQANKPLYEGEVWVVAEETGDEITAATFELVGKARELADSLNTQVGVALAGNKVAHLGRSLIEAGADKVYSLEHELLAEFDPASYRKAIAGVIEKYWPQIVLFAATPQGRVLAPMVSYRVGCGLTADCTSLDIRDSSRKGEIAVLMQTRPALGGNVMATICTKDSKCQMATARPGVMKRLPADPGRKGQIIPCPVELTKNDLSLEIINTERGTGHVNFHADIIISGGKGLQSKERYMNLLTTLCTAVGKQLGVTVERGASRAAVEQGYTERVHQVGQTGTAVGPTVYLAMGISGAIQHMIGVANSQTILAINNDPAAPIFKQCDYYMVANVEDVVPQLVEVLGDQ